MIIYNVTVKVDNYTAENWMKWMKEIHIPDVMDTGLFTHNRFLHLVDHDDETGKTFTIQYECNNMNDYKEYLEKHSNRLQKEHTDRYKDKFVAFRTIMKSV